MMQLHRNIKLIRLLTKETQVVFGARFGLTEGKMKSYEGGKASPDILTQRRIADFAGITVELLNDKELSEADIKIRVEKDDQKAEKVPYETSTDLIRGFLKTTNELIAGQNKLIDAHKDLTDAHKGLADSNKDLALTQKKLLNRISPDTNLEQALRLEKLATTALLGFLQALKNEGRLKKGEIIAGLGMLLSADLKEDERKYILELFADN